MASSATEVNFARLHLPRPLSEAMVGAFVTRLVVEPVRAPVVLEIRADGHGVRHLLGARLVDLPRLSRLFTDLLPGTVLTSLGAAEQRVAVTAATRVRLRSSGLPLRTDVAETTTRALLSALAAPLREGEAMAVQFVLGPRRAPRTVPKEVADPETSLLNLLTLGSRPASTEIRARLKERHGQPGRALTIRLGVASPEAQRRSWFLTSLLSALKVAQSPGVRMDLVRDSAKRLNQARRPWWWTLGLGASELVGLLGWPLGDGDDDLPGLPPLHPRPLRAAAHVHHGRRVFARSAAPGDDRLLGISPKDQTYHGIAYGPSGSGKTTALLHLICADIDAGHPVVILDPKQQLIDDVLARLPAHRVRDVVELNAADDAPCGFNPLDVTGRDPDVVVDGILAAFEAVFADGWGWRTADIYSAALRTLARSSTPDRQATLVDLPRILTDPEFRRPLVGRVQSDIALAGFWAWYEDQGPTAQAAVIAAPLNKIRQYLLRPALVRILDQRGSGFRLRDMFKLNKIVLIPLNEGLVGPGVASLLGSLVIADVWQATQERAGLRNPTPGVVYVDEAPRFLNLPVSLADALAVSRSLGVGWFLAAQFRDQFPPALRNAVDSNARSKLVFASEYDDARDTARLAPELEPEDFMALPRFHAYANLVADGAPSGWALVKTLPLSPATTDPAVMRAMVRRNYAPPRVPNPAPATPTPPTPTKIGRKRRHSGGRP